MSKKGKFGNCKIITIIREFLSFCLVNFKAQAKAVEDNSKIFSTVEAQFVIRISLSRQ